MCPYEQIQAWRSNPAPSPQEIRAGKRALERLCRQSEGLVHCLTERYLVKYPHLAEDILQEGRLGLTIAICRFDPSKGTKLSTLATPWVKQRVTRLLAHQGHSVSVPINQVLRINRARRTGNFDGLNRDLVASVNNAQRSALGARAFPAATNADQEDKIDDVIGVIAYYADLGHSQQLLLGLFASYCCCKKPYSELGKRLGVGPVKARSMVASLFQVIRSSGGIPGEVEEWLDVLEIEPA